MHSDNQAVASGTARSARFVGRATASRSFSTTSADSIHAGRRTASSLGLEPGGRAGRRIAHCASAIASVACEISIQAPHFIPRCPTSGRPAGGSSGARPSSAPAGRIRGSSRTCRIVGLLRSTSAIQQAATEPDLEFERSVDLAHAYCPRKRPALPPASCDSAAAGPQALGTATRCGGRGSRRSGCPCILSEAADDQGREKQQSWLDCAGTIESDLHGSSTPTLAVE